MIHLLAADRYAATARWIVARACQRTEHLRMNATDKRKRFRQILESSRCVASGSVFDPISIRIAEDLGFEVAMLGGSTVSLTVLGAPDLSLPDLSEVAGQAYRICRASNLPLFIDADAGFGNALNAKRTVEELEAAGVSALCIEDTILPQQFGESGSRLVSIEEGVGKVQAALAGRQDPNLTIAARTSALALTSLEDGIARMKAYEAAGADALFVAGGVNRQQLEALAAVVSRPMIVGGALTEDMRDVDYLARHRVRMWNKGHFPIKAAIQAVYVCLSEMKSGRPSDKLSNLPSRELLDRVTRSADYDRLINSTLKAHRAPAS